MKPHVLYGVLNWGLGHATRSKVIIDSLLRNRFRVTLASDGEALIWLKKEYPQLKVLEFPAYNIKYSRLGWNNLKIASQAVKIAKAAKAEQEEVRKFVIQNPLAGIISDNRLGFRHPEIPSVYISHQLNIKAGIFTPFAGMAHRFFINRFDECWVSDTPQNKYAGYLSRADIKVPKRYLGPLSRYRRKEAQADGTYYLAILSGPEPQRSLLQKRLLEQAKEIEDPFILVGANEKAKAGELAKNVELKGILGSDELLKLIRGARLIISRSGYSSIMDYSALGKKALLIPTPRQGEQEYLSKLHQQKGHYHRASQYHLRFPYDLQKALEVEGFKEEKQHRLPPKLFSLFKRKRKS